MNAGGGMAAEGGGKWRAPNDDVLIVGADGVSFIILESL